MFDIGWQEVGLTAVVALLVLGPKELPGLMRTAGTLVRKARLIAHDFRMNLEELADEAEFEEFKKNAMTEADSKEPVLASPHPNPPPQAGEGTLAAQADASSPSPAQRGRAGEGGADNG